MEKARFCAYLALAFLLSACGAVSRPEPEIKPEPNEVVLTVDNQHLFEAEIAIANADCKVLRSQVFRVQGGRKSSFRLNSSGVFHSGNIFAIRVRLWTAGGMKVRTEACSLNGTSPWPGGIVRLVIPPDLTHLGSPSVFQPPKR